MTQRTQRDKKYLDADAEGSNLYEAKLRHAAYAALRRKI